LAGGGAVELLPVYVPSSASCISSSGGVDSSPPGCDGGGVVGVVELLLGDVVVNSSYDHSSSPYVLIP